MTGIHCLTGKRLTYTVAAYDTHTDDVAGRWIVVINGNITRWYAMERPALRCLRNARVGAYGMSFGEAF